MNSKIIFWMNDALALVGLPKTLQEKHNFDIYAILDVTDKQKKFFQKQELIKFSKIWFFHDYISKATKKPDTKYLKLIEKKHKIDLSLLASNERFFNKWNKYYKFSSDEKLLILEQECKLFEKILDEVQPDFLITAQTTLHHNHLFYEICKARGIKVLMIRSSFFVGKHIISSEFDSIDNTQINGKFHFNSLVDIQNYLKKYDYATKTKLELENWLVSKTDYLKAILKFLVSSNTNVKTHYTYYGRSKFAVLKGTIFSIIKKRFRESFINKNLIRDIKNKKPLIYFPLQIEPERSLLIQAPNYTNQIEVITNIVKSLPAGYELYVKEHPANVFRQWRSVDDYKKIMKLPNVKLIHPSVKSEDLIIKSSLVITISSTSGLEAAFHNKPSIIFADLDYSILPSVHKIKAIDELPYAIKTSLKKEVKSSDLNYYINLIEENSFELDFDSIDSDFDSNFHYGGFLADAEIPIEKMRLFLERHSADFDKIAAECLKKI